MTKLAVTIKHGHCIYELNIGSSIAPRAIFENTNEDPDAIHWYPDVIDYVSEDTIFYSNTRGYRDIYRTSVKEPNTHEDELVYHHPNYIRDIKIRDDGIRYKFFFSAYHSKTEVRLFYLDEMGEAVLYHTISGSELKFPDPCSPGEETAWNSWGGHFVFDDKDNLYICTGGKVPSGIYKISGAGPETVTGDIERIHHEPNAAVDALEFMKPNILLYSSGTKIFKLNLETLESVILYDTASISGEDIQNISLMDEGFKKKYEIHKTPTIFHKKKIKLVSS